MFDGLSHHQAGYTARELNALQPTLKGSLSLFAHLAVFLCNQRNQLVGMFLHLLMKVEEHTTAVEHRSRAPRRERGLRGSDGSRNFIGSAQWNLRHFFAGSRIELDDSLTARNLRCAVHINGTWLELTGNCTAG